MKVTSTRWMVGLSVMGDARTGGRAAASVELMTRCVVHRVTGVACYVPVIVGRPRRRIGNIPAEATSFVGRRHELAEARRMLAAARLVSLVGPGGVGKTRLAVRLATDLAAGSPAADGGSVSPRSVNPDRWLRR